ncbi:MAG: hypothetical protein MR531_12080 [Lachnospiraceae bacterium]|nr:hypothetical protein [Lachnospiraceae bacterium]
MFTWKNLIQVLMSNNMDLDAELKEDIKFILDGYIVSFNNFGEPVKYLPEEEFAAKCGVGVATVRAWCQADMIKRYVFAGKNFILETEKNPMEDKNK